ncbi:MAG: hypothetical protein KDD73_04115 [Anaerolineales bacterium]|nr:hypothetical protein [Anaerolineales bacterium]MCB9127824.1 hypothetical protein [Ardenticatenales bacterium]MCB9172891.1 hypothetical protein [Ardenticatenales bacterium]
MTNERAFASEKFVCAEACIPLLKATQPADGGWELVTVSRDSPVDQGMWLVNETSRISVSAAMPGPYDIGIEHLSGGVSTTYGIPPSEKYSGPTMAHSSSYEVNSRPTEITPVMSCFITGRMARQSTAPSRGRWM